MALHLPRHRLSPADPALQAPLSQQVRRALAIARTPPEAPLTDLPADRLPRADG